MEERNNEKMIMKSQHYSYKAKNILTPNGQEGTVSVRLITIESTSTKASDKEDSLTSPPTQEKTAENAEHMGMTKVLSDQDVLKHTASLWKYNPVPQHEPEPYREFITESTTVGSCHIIAARVRGKKHKHEGTNCDDWFETRSIGAFIVIAVADGAGSKKFSRIGAKSACLGAMSFLEKALQDLAVQEKEMQADLAQTVTKRAFQQMVSQLAGIVQNAVIEARKNVVKAYQQRRGDENYKKVVGRDLELNDFASTFLLTIALPLEKTGELLVVNCQVGDGMTAALNTKASYEQIVTLIGNADSGTFSGETEFLTSDAICSMESLMNRTKVARKRFDVIMSMTDGVSDDYDPPGKEMLRLYTDLCINRVLDFPKLEKICATLSPEARKKIREKIPQAQSYPTVSGEVSPKMVSIQYTRDFCELNKIDLREMWEKYQPYLGVMMQEMEQVQGKNAATRLKDWLDNYVIRGSFDDRTLVILQRGGN